MRVLYVLRYYPTLSETFVYRELSELIRRGVPVVVLAIGERADGALQDELPEVEVWRPPRGLRATGLLRDTREAVRLGWLTEHLRAKDVARVAWAAAKARAWGATRVHAHFAGEAGEWAWGVAELLGCAFSLTVHASDLFKPRKSLPKMLAAAQPVITVADHHAGVLERDYGVHSRVVRCGIEPARYAIARPSRLAMRVISVGRYVPKKGHDELVRAWREASITGSLRLVSDAPAELGGGEVSVGPLSPSQVPQALASSDLFALACRVAPDGDRDGIPVAMMEAMAAGLPVLTTNVSGLPELVDEAVGWVVPPDDPRALLEALRAASTQPDERVRRGAAARERVVSRGFTVRAQVDGLLAAWSTP